MSTKENIDFIKEELSSEEKFLESSIKLERFYKKYKVAIISAVAIAVVGTIGYYTQNYLHHKAIVASNEAYNKLLKDPKDTKSLEILKSKNQPLYALYMLQTSVKNSDSSALQRLSSDKNSIISDIAKYELSNIDGKYSEYNGELYKDMAIYQEAFALIKNEKYQEAKAKLDNIGEKSSVYALANLLRHHLITKLDK